MQGSCRTGDVEREMGHARATRGKSLHGTGHALCYRRSVIGRSERAPALLLSFSYLLLGTVAWWSSPWVDIGPGGTRGTGATMLALWLTTIVLVVFALLPGRDRLATWVTPAVVGPLALAPLLLHPGDGSAIAIALLWPAALAPLGQVLRGPASGG